MEDKEELKHNLDKFREEINICGFCHSGDWLSLYAGITKKRVYFEIILLSETLKHKFRKIWITY